MARWAVCWLLVIAVATTTVYVGTNTLIAARAFHGVEYAMRPLGGLGSPTCTQAARGLVRAGDGAAPNAPSEQRRAYDRAAAAVVAACGTA